MGGQLGLETPLGQWRFKKLNAKNQNIMAKADLPPAEKMAI